VVPTQEGEPAKLLTWLTFTFWNSSHCLAIFGHLTAAALGIARFQEATLYPQLFSAAATAPKKAQVLFAGTTKSSKLQDG
jgi:hypothetical protein